MNDYFFLDSQNRQQGPISPTKFAENGVTADTLVWCVGMKDWTRAAAVPELHDYVGNPHQQGMGGTQPPQANPYSRAERPGNAQSAQIPPYPCPNSHMVEAILVTICCCLPFGIVAIVKASQVSSFYLHGYYDQSVLASSDAMKWVMISVICGVLSFGLFGLSALLR